MEKAVRRVKPMNLKRAMRVGHRVEHALKPFDVGCLLDRVNEALIPD